MEAARWDRTACVALLLQRGASPNLQDKDGKTALSEAAGNGHTASVEVLLQHGANLNLPEQKLVGTHHYPC